MRKSYRIRDIRGHELRHLAFGAPYLLSDAVLAIATTPLARDIRPAKTVYDLWNPNLTQTMTALWPKYLGKVNH